MLNLYDELIAVTRAFQERGVEYAVCGGMAMAIHSIPRNTVDLDLLIRREDLEQAEEIAMQLGYTFKARPMKFDGGTVEIHRISKIDPDTHDPLMLDFLLVTPAVEDVWAAREVLRLEDGAISVVSREGLIKLKSSRLSERDIEDIRLLRGEGE
ncbi:MAG TPA: nucleotidyltransferase family protein [Thermoanaerobaculia bacterium]|nr:nucleotidyltransferase family protein [Thermoanaerobaculia bacterium]